jgi:hypothetical protein
MPHTKCDGPHPPSKQSVVTDNSCYQAVAKETCLRLNIYELPSSFIADAEVEGLDRKIRKNIGETLEYCCQYWSDHLKVAQPKNVLMPDMAGFIQEKGVFWLEAMSLMKALPRCGEILKVALQVSVAVARKSAG